MEDRAVRVALAVAGASVTVAAAHWYSQALARAVTRRRGPSMDHALSALKDQVFLAIPAGVAIAIMLIAELGVISLGTAFVVTIAASFTALFVLGVLAGAGPGDPRIRNAWARGVGIGAANVVLGAAIIGIEHALR